MNNYQENLNKKIEETKKFFEKMFGGSCSYHEDDRWGRKDGVFTIKLGNNKKDNSNQEIEKNIKESTGNGIIFHEKNSQGGYVISSKFKNPEIEKQKNELIEEDARDDKKQIDKSRKSLNRYFIDNGNSLTYSVEKVSNNEVIKESYYEPRSEEEKKQIIARNQKIREQERSRAITDKEVEQIKTETSPDSDKKEQKSEQETNQQISLQNKNKQNIYYGVGIVSLVFFLLSLMVVRLKKKR